MLAFALLVLAVIPAIAARHGGTCRECRNPIRVDELIVEVEPKVWVHDECVPVEVEENWDWPDPAEQAA